MSSETEKGTVLSQEAPHEVVTEKKCGGTLVDVALRVVLLAACIAAVVVMVTSKQRRILMTPIGPQPNSARFQDSPAFIYFVVALSVAGLYSIVTALASLSFLRKPNFPAKLLFHFIVFDVVMLGIVAAATGAAGGVGYIGLKGNSHVRWNKICNVYGKFCRHVGGSIFTSLAAGVVLVVLVIVNSHCLYRRIPASS